MKNTETELKSYINSDLIFMDFGEFPEITEETRKKNMLRVFTGGVRINNGLYRTDAETEEYIENSLKRKLP